MAELAPSVRDYLANQGVAYQCVPDGTEREAEDSVRTGRVASWIVGVGADYRLLVLPEGFTPTLKCLGQRIEGHRVRFASESEIRHLFYDCDTGAIPPFGDAYGVPVYLSRRLTNLQTLDCPSGQPGLRLLVNRTSFERTVNPALLACP
jgi:Ala-tRNA(Pro) deacylase